MEKFTYAPALRDKVMKAPQTTDTKERLERAFVELLKFSPDDGLRWEGTKTDLIEIIYATYLDSVVTDEYGCPATFGSLVRRAFSILHMTEPANPRSYASRARNRKGIRQRPFLERYERITSRGDTVEPVETLIHTHVATDGEE